MTDKEKQIEEMAKILANKQFPSKQRWCKNAHCTDCSKCIQREYATALFNAGYRKIDGNTSDGYHTYNELYHHRAVLFTMICNQNKEIAWKSKKHSDGTMFDNMFIVGIETPVGQATYHYDIEPYWDYFKVKELETAPIWDGHTPSQAIDRILEMSKEAASYRKQSETVREIYNKIYDNLPQVCDWRWLQGAHWAMQIAAEFGKED